LAFVSEAKNSFLRALAFDQFYQPSSAKLEIEIFLSLSLRSVLLAFANEAKNWIICFGTSSFDQFPQLSSMKPKLGDLSQSITLQSVSLAFVNEAKY
jgi:hypothetical protein